MCGAAVGRVARETWQGIHHERSNISSLAARVAVACRSSFELTTSSFAVFSSFMTVWILLFSLSFQTASDSHCLGGKNPHGRILAVGRLRDWQENTVGRYARCERIWSERFLPPRRNRYQLPCLGECTRGARISKNCRTGPLVLTWFTWQTNKRAVHVLKKDEWFYSR